MEKLKEIAEKTSYGVRLSHRQIGYKAQHVYIIKDKKHEVTGIGATPSDAVNRLYEEMLALGLL